MQCAILAGGLATRLGDRARGVPKFLLPVGGRPFAAWLLERLAAAAFDDAVVCIGHLGDQIEQALGDGRRFGLRLRYAHDGPTARGTGGALRRASSMLDASFLVTYGDALLPFDYGRPLAHLRDHPGALGVMAVYRNDNRFDRSNVRLDDSPDGPRVAEYRKLAPGAPVDPTLGCIDYGAIALRREAIERLPAGGFAALDALLGELACEGRLLAVEATARFYEIGSLAGLADLEGALGRGALDGEGSP